MASTRHPLHEAVDLLAESVVFADLADPASVDAVLAALGSLEIAVGDAAAPDLIAAVTTARELIHRQLDEAADLDAARVRLGAIVSGLQVTVSRGDGGDAEEPTAAPAMSEPAVTPAMSEPATDRPVPPVSADDAAISFLADDELTADFVTRSLEHMSEAEEALIRLESDPVDSESVNKVLATFHTVKGMAGFLQLLDIERATHDAETILAAYRDTTDPVPAAVTVALLSAVDRVRDLVAPLCPTVAVMTAAAAGGLVMGDGPSQQRARKETIRVDAERFDQLLDAIGELVIAESSVSRLALEGADPLLFARQIESLDKITRSLQEMATLLRMVDLEQTFRRMQRVVRDVAQRQGRAVEFGSDGEDTRLDKTIVDAISDPLVHILRNAVDHGLAETPEQRRAADKPEFGRVRLSAFHRGGSVYIEVEDDGLGLDRDAILARAIERGMVAAGETLSDRAIFNLIFEPGFSTRTEVTEVSGRGVGMDVVRRAIEALRGSVEVRSEQGRGTTVSLRLPLTLAIIDGMLVRCGDERYVVPTLSVIRSVRPTANEVVGVLGEAEMLRQPDGVIRLLRLSRLLGVSDAELDVERAIAVVIEDEGERFALLVDELLGKQQVVIKPLVGSVAMSPAISGASVMADGSAALILDVAGLARIAGVDSSRDDRA